MLHFLLRRLLLTIPVLLGVATLVFSLIHLVPGDPVQTMLGESAAPQEIVRVRTQLGLDRPLHIQYWAFLRGVGKGDLGVSLRTNEPVAQAITDRMPATIELAIAAMCLAVVVAIPLGIIAAVGAGTVVDYAATTLALAGISIPNFWLGPLLAIVFAVTLGWLPVSGSGTLAHLVLPAITLGAPLGAVLARMTRASLLEELRELYVLAARARGVSRAGAVITETIFAWPGVGRLLIQSINFRDYPLVQGCILFIAVTYVAMNLLTDLAYGLLDPRIRYE